jgi:hypothetical protein
MAVGADDVGIRNLTTALAELGAIGAANPIAPFLNYQRGC